MRMDEARFNGGTIQSEVVAISKAVFIAWIEKNSDQRMEKASVMLNSDQRMNLYSTGEGGAEPPNEHHDVRNWHNRGPKVGSAVERA